MYTYCRLNRGPSEALEKKETEVLTVLVLVAEHSTRLSRLLLVLVRQFGLHALCLE